MGEDRPPVIWCEMAEEYSLPSAKEKKNLYGWKARKIMEHWFSKLGIKKLKFPKKVSEPNIFKASSAQSHFAPRHPVHNKTSA